MSRLLFFILFGLASVTVFSEGMSSRSIGNSQAYPRNVAQTPDGFAQVIGFTNATQRTTAITLGYTDDQAGSTAYKTALADTANAANCQAAYGKPCGQLTKTQYSAVLALQSQTLSVSASPSSISVGGTATLTTTGNQSTVTYTASGPCTVSGSTVTASNTAGTCTITANAPAALPSYKAAAPTNISINVQAVVLNGYIDAAQRTAATALGYTDDQAGATLYQQALADTGNATNCQAAYGKPCGQLTKTQYSAVLALQSQTLSVSASPSSISVGGTATLTTTGNRSTVTYTASGACTVSGSTVTASNTAGTCTVTANAPYTSGYKAASPTNISINVQAVVLNGYIDAAQRTAALALGYPDTQAGSTLYIAALADTANATTCQQALSNTVTTCGQLTKTQYSAVLALQSQTLSVSASPSRLNRGGAATLTTTGNRSTVTYTASGACTVSGSTVTASNTAGTCTVTANAPYTSGYKAAAPTNISITVSSLVQQQLTLTGLQTVTIKASWQLNGALTNQLFSYSSNDRWFQTEGRWVYWLTYPDNPETCSNQANAQSNRSYNGTWGFKIPGLATAVPGTCRFKAYIDAYTQTHAPFDSYAAFEGVYEFEVVR